MTNTDSKSTHLLRVAVFISGNGSNLQAIIDAVTNNQLNIEIVGVISNKADAYGLQRATQAGIPAVALAGKKMHTFEQLASKQLIAWQADMLVLAGFMRVLSAEFIHSFTGIMLNIHPSLLPKYKGLNTHQRVLNAGEYYHGCSVHLVTPALDSGQVLAQGIINVQPNDTADSLAERIHPIEHQLLPLVISLFSRGDIVLSTNSQNHTIANLRNPLQQLPLQLIL